MNALSQSARNSLLIAKSRFRGGEEVWEMAAIGRKTQSNQHMPRDGPQHFIRICARILLQTCGLLATAGVDIRVALLQYAPRRV